MKTLLSCVILLVGVQPAIAAQTFYGVAGGLNYAGPDLANFQFADDHYTHGLALQLSVGRQFGDRFAMRMDGLINRFVVQQPFVIVAPMCPQGGLCAHPAASGGESNAMGLTALRVSGLLTLDPPRYPVRMYVIGGAGAYYFYQHPSAEGAVRAGLAAGAGFTINVHNHSRLFVEGVYNRILGAPSQPTWLLPLTFGVRF
ncbi:MAG TPA: hypothetical protein VNH14_07580 [Gemmatimonadales bacterium]|nr:hypothetical protein [Gemmatimonadales bacterium]